MRVRKSVKNWSKIAIMKLEAVVFGVMQAVMINCKSTLPGLKEHCSRYSCAGLELSWKLANCYFIAIRSVVLPQWHV